MDPMIFLVALACLGVGAGVGFAIRGKGNADAAISAESTLQDLGLDSLDLATVVATLELELDHDPFASATPSFDNMGQFAALYEGV